jgi:hypothetical protein
MACQRATTQIQISLPFAAGATHLHSTFTVSISCQIPNWQGPLTQSLSSQATQFLSEAVGCGIQIPCGLFVPFAELWAHSCGKQVLDGFVHSFRMRSFQHDKQIVCG